MKEGDAWIDVNGDRNRLGVGDALGTICVGDPGLSGGDGPVGINNDRKCLADGGVGVSLPVLRDLGSKGGDERVGVNSETNRFTGEEVFDGVRFGETCSIFEGEGVGAKRAQTLLAVVEAFDDNPDNLLLIPDV